MCQVMQIANRMKNTRRAQCSATKTAQYSRVSHKVLTAMTFTRSGMALCLMKLVMYGPIFG